MKTWIIRLLLTIIILIGLTIGALNFIGGNSDTHKKGLEDAFSASLQGEVTFGKLNSFNILPQLGVDVTDFTAANVMGLGDITADHVSFSFNFLDVVLKRRQITGIDITHMTIDKGVYGNEKMIFDTVAIVPQADNQPSGFSIKGTYGDKPLTVFVAMKQMTKSIPPAYGFDTSNPFTMTVGNISVQGSYVPITAENTALQDLIIKNGNTRCKTLPEKNRFTMASFTGQIFPELINASNGKITLETACKNITRYGL